VDAADPWPPLDPQHQADADPWPPLDPRRVADAARGLAAQTPEPALRARLHALAAVIGGLPAVAPPDPARARLQQALAEALAGEDEPAVLAAARRLAARDRACAPAVDWSAVSGVE